jgi:hypothetical protein
MDFLLLDAAARRAYLGPERCQARMPCRRPGTALQLFIAALAPPAISDLQASLAMIVPAAGRSGSSGLTISRSASAQGSVPSAHARRIAGPRRPTRNGRRSAPSARETQSLAFLKSRRRPGLLPRKSGCSPFSLWPNVQPPETTSHPPPPGNQLPGARAELLLP